MKRITIKEIQRKKGRTPITCLTSYTNTFTKILDKYCDIILVGDSVGMVLYGMKTTRNVKIDTMIQHGKAVKDASKRSLVIVDMPYKTYTTKLKAYKNAKKIIKITKCDGVKLEGGKNIINQIKILVKNKIPVMGHLGLLPQTAKGKFKSKGRTAKEKKQLINDALLLQSSGVFAIVLECIKTFTAKQITQTLKIPTIGIGSSVYCDGQVLVTDDLIGLNNTNIKFVKKFVNIKQNINLGLKKFTIEVKSKKYPSKKHSY